MQHSAQNEHEDKTDEALIAVDQLNEAFERFFRSCYGVEGLYTFCINDLADFDLEESAIRIVKESELTLISNREERIDHELYYNMLGAGPRIAGKMYNDKMLRSLCATKPDEGDLFCTMKNAVLSTLDKIDAVMYEVPDELKKEVLEKEVPFWLEVPILIYFQGLEDHWAVIELGWTD